MHTLAGASVVLLILFTSVHGVRVGDEQHAMREEGHFYVFADGVVHVIDPDTKAIVANITADHEGRPFTANGKPLTWSDAVYMENGDKSQYHVFINAYAPGSDTDNFVYVLDTKEHKVLSRVQVGARPVHIYAVPEDNSVWTHSDGLGTFDVIHQDNVDRLNVSSIPALDKVPDHGKLIVDPDMWPAAFATHVSEPFVFEVDLEKRTDTNKHSFAEEVAALNQSCDGTHAVAYSAVNKHLYLECVGGKVMEWDTLNKTVVGFLPLGGDVYTTKDEKHIIITSKGSNKAAVVEPRDNGELSEVKYWINVPGNPGSPAWWPKEGTDKGLDSYKLYFPLTMNTNKDLIDAVGVTAVTSPGFGFMPTDCVEPASPIRAALESARLATSVKTSDCGSCRPTAFSRDPNDWQYNISGFQAIDLADVAAFTAQGINATTELISAGAVLPGKPYSADAHPCSYGFTYRKAHLGDGYVAQRADFPVPSIMLLDAASGEVSGYVATADNPKTIQYVPPHSSDSTAYSTEPSSSAGTPTTSSSAPAAGTPVPASSGGAATAAPGALASVVSAVAFVVLTALW